MEDRVKIEIADLVERGAVSACVEVDNEQQRIGSSKEGRDEENVA